MTNYPNDGLCHETSGFLFSHRCDHIAVKECVRCGKVICQDHAHSIADGLACTTCLKQEAQTQPPMQPQGAPGAVPGTTPGIPPVVNSPTGYRSRPYYDDPYFYGSHWYPGYGFGFGYGLGYYGGRHSSRSSTSDTASSASDPASAAAGHDPNDFTEGDAENLKNEGDEAFESEMGES